MIEFQVISNTYQSNIFHTSSAGKIDLELTWKLWFLFQALQAVDTRIFPQPSQNLVLILGGRFDWLINFKMRPIDNATRIQNFYRSATDLVDVFTLCVWLKSPEVPEINTKIHQFICLHLQIQLILNKFSW